MPRLNTFKDFEALDDHLEIDLYTLSIVKQSAIQDLKSIIRMGNGNKSVIAYIQWKFHISEEDLK